MAKGVEISTNEEKYVLEGLKNGVRVDGRSLDVSRDPEINLHEEFGYVDVIWGNTKLAVRISAEITQPYEDRPFEGLFFINTEISPMASPHFENGKNSDDETLLARLIEKAVRRSNALDLESLCIVAGSKVWTIRADVHFLDYDGGLIDASCLGVVTALQHFRKPDISVVGEEVVVYSVDERQPTPLSILHVPICVTFLFFNPSGVAENIKGDLNEEISIIDATAQEEQLRDGSLLITVNKNREIIQLSKTGGLPIDAMLIMDLLKKAYVIADTMTDMIKNLLKAHEDERYKRMNMKELVAEASR